MKVNFYLKNPKAEYESSIFITVNYGGKRIRVYTNEKIHPDFWNPEKQRVRQTKKFPTHPEFNVRLDNIENLIKNLYRRWKIDNGESEEPSGALFSNLIKSELGKTPEDDLILKNLKTFWGFFDNFIKSSEAGTRVSNGKPVALTTIKNYKNLFNTLKAYERKTQKRFDFDSFDIHFYNQYKNYLIITKNYSTNSVGKQISNIKLVLREAYEEGYSKNTIFNSSKFKVTRENPETVYLNNEEIEELINLDLSANKRLDRVRDLFIIGCLTGLRFSDVSKLNEENIKDGMLEIVQTKTKNPVTIPLRKQVMDIIEKYGYAFPKSISNQKFNQYLREVCEQCESLKKEITVKAIKGGKEIKITHPKFEYISTHTARRSFATNEFLAKDIKVFQIMAITGHKTEKSFYRYIRMTSEENAKDIASIWKMRESSKQPLKILKLKKAAN